MLIAIGFAAVVLRLGVQKTRPRLQFGSTHVILAAAAGFAFCSALWSGTLDEHVGKFRLLDSFGIVPYVALLILGLALVMFFPAIALWLPGTMQYK